VVSTKRPTISFERRFAWIRATSTFFTTSGSSRAIWRPERSTGSLKLQEKLTEAAAEYDLALRANPNLLEALIGLADIRREQSACDPAAELYRRAEVVRRTYEGAYGLGVCLSIAGQHAQAAEQFREALEHDPRSAVAHFALGSTELQMGQTASAVRELERAVALEPRMRQAFYLLGRAYAALGLGERSRQAFAKAEQLAQAERSGDRKVLGVDRPPTGVIRPRLDQE
jgi:tetratricopeptide (TPR) repeat protein